MALGSRLKAIETALRSTIDARSPGLDGVTVSRGHPHEHLQREHVWIDRVRFTDEPKALKAGTNPRRQSLTFEIIVRVSQEGDDAPTLRDRAYDIADEVEEALRADIGLSGAADFGGVELGEAEPFVDTDGRVFAIRLDARYTATKG